MRKGFIPLKGFTDIEDLQHLLLTFDLRIRTSAYSLVLNKRGGVQIVGGGKFSENLINGGSK